MRAVRAGIVVVGLALACVALVWPVAQGAGAAKAANPCLDPKMRAKLWCPDLVLKKPFGLAIDPLVRPGRLVLRAGNSIDNIGLGPAELHGVRMSRYLMRGRQRIYRRGGGRMGITTGARLFFKAIPGQGHYWKFLHAARFELWRLDSHGQRVKRVRTGPKVAYCLRDLKHTRPQRRRSPARFFYPGCNKSAATRRVTLGTSVGWSDVYPPTYNEQWIDVTRLRGCFAYRQIVDPLNGIYESNERNNASSVTVRLPFRPGPQHCPGKRTAAPTPAPDTGGGGTTPGY
jgi:hypothetical protein